MTIPPWEQQTGEWGLPARLEAKVNRIVQERLNGIRPMDLDEFANYRISVKNSDFLTMRHHTCPDHWVKDIEIMPPFSEVNLKNLMVEATAHWQESHRQD